MRRSGNDDLVAAVDAQVSARALKDRSTLSPAERDLWQLDVVYLGEVANGGHHQFLFNSNAAALANSVRKLAGETVDLIDGRGGEP